MSGSDEDGIFLNLCNDGSTSVVKFKQKSRKRKHQQSGKREKIKSKHPVNRENRSVKERKVRESLLKSHSGAVQNGKTPGRDINKASNINSHAGNKRHSDSSSQVFSSLFTKNPEIPHVDVTKTVQKESCQLFSETAVNETTLSDRLLKTLKDRLGFQNFTEIQSHAIPAFLSSSDVLIKSPTGSGKTLAYTLPMIQRLQQIQPKITRMDGPYALILLPTRELAIQSYEVIEALCRTSVWIVPGLIVGGEKKKAEKSRIRKGINIIIATPGRLLDHLNTTRSLSLKNLLLLIFDEADQLLDMGFEQTISQILAHAKEQCSRKIQIGLLSATLNTNVKNLASMSLVDPKLLDVSARNDEPADDQVKPVKGDVVGNDIAPNCETKDVENDGMYQTPSTLKQYFVIAPAKLRLVCLISFLSKYGFRNENGKIIVFFSSKSSTELHSRLLESEAMKTFVAPHLSEVYKLHGDMIPKERHKVFQKFKKCKKGILLSTDVAARGLDLPLVKWIIQYSCPLQVKDYIHRVGRTARIGSKGEALLFLLPSEIKYISILNAQKINIQKLGAFNILKYLDPKCEKKGNQSAIERVATNVQNSLERLIDEDHELKDIAESAFRSFIQSYAAYPSHLKEIFHIKRLHLGHIAKSFALRTAPGQMKIPSIIIEKSKKRCVKLKKRKRKAVDMSESGGGVLMNGPQPSGRNSKRKRKK